jgi:hypothetical protein
MRIFSSAPSVVARKTAAASSSFLKKVKDGKINDANCFPLVLWAWHAEKYAPKPGSITVRSRILFAVA